MECKEIKQRLLSVDADELRTGVMFGDIRARIVYDYATENPFTAFDYVGTCVSWAKTTRTSFLTGTVDGDRGHDGCECWEDVVYCEVISEHGVYAADGFNYPLPCDYKGRNWEKYRDAIIDRYAVVGDEISAGDRSTSNGVVFFAMRSELRKEMGVKRINTYKAKLFLNAQSSDVKVWAEGEVYGWIIDRPPVVGEVYTGETEHLESCFSCYREGYTIDALSDHLSRILPSD